LRTKTDPIVTRGPRGSTAQVLSHELSSEDHVLLNFSAARIS